jgi:hypothetical protein
MLKRFLIYFSVILTVSSCYNSGGPSKPKDLISKDKMVNILIDARLMGSANRKDKDTMEAHGIEISSYVFDKHAIDSLQFALSNNYYSYHIKDYKEIFGKVKDSLETLKVVFKDLEIKEEREIKRKKEEDSINALKLPDSLKALPKKDALKILRAQDSLKKITKKDSLFKANFKNKLKEEEGVLISPVSETSSQPHK